MNNKLKTVLLLFATFSLMNGQIREYKIHNRGMLHETVFNTGEIGRAWATGEAGNVTNVPLMEWPPYSKAYVEGIEYSGQHNILGAGLYIAANVKGNPGKDNRKYALCGGVGASSPEVSFGRWSFPLAMEEIENFPILDDGTLNPNYNPNEAEEIITASWATPIGITVTRTSRAWSYPDYDDMIIYEFEFVYTGDTDGNPATIETDSTLTDAMILFIYGFAPSMYGYQRYYQEWKYTGGIYRGDQHGYWDADYWLAFNLTTHTGADDFVTQNLAAKPEPNRDIFLENAQTGKFGGGLNSPQAPGYCMLYYDTNHLAIVDPDDPNNNESEAVKILRTTNGEFYEIHENKHIKQPWSNKVSTGNTRSSKMKDWSINPNSRWSGVYSSGSTTWPKVPNNDPRWYGRAAYNYRQSVDAGQKHIVFGPYTLDIGDTLRYAYAEVIGYGGQAGKKVEGGPSGQNGVLVQWNPIQSWDSKVIINGETLTEHYLTDFGYPDYVNSDVKNVQQVAHKAYTAYLGAEPQLPAWPEDNPSRGNYRIPVPPPAPEFVLENTDEGNVQISWGRSVEDFTHPMLTGKLEKFKIYKSVAGLGPWDLLDSILVNTVNENDEYIYLDADQRFKIGEKRYYAVTSVDEHGNESGKSSLTSFSKNIGAVTKLGDVHVVPNPFVGKSGFVGSGEVDDQIGFYGLTEECTIRIYSYSGQLIETIEHNEPLYTAAYFQVTRNGQDIASGVYFYVVSTPDGQQSNGKFVIIK